MNILLTQCKECIFLDNHKCFWQKDIYDFNDNKVINGFCHHKRSLDWITKNNYPNLEDSKKLVLDEEIQISLILLCFDHTQSDINNKIDEILKIDKIKSVVFILNDPKIALFLYRKIQCIKDFNWSMKVSYDQSISQFELVDQTVSELKTNWVMFTTPLLPILSPTKALEHISNEKCNNVALYLDDKNLPFACNKYAFLELHGNEENPWLDKVRMFDNWKEVCQQI